jgi:hypothetical protein
MEFLKRNKYIIYPLLFFFFIALVLFVFAVESAKEKAPYGYLFLTLICLITSGILRFNKGLTTSGPLIQICKILMIIGFLDMALSFTTIILQGKKAEAKILLLASHIDRFKKDLKRLPFSLQELCPSYLEELPEIYIGFFPTKITYTPLEYIVNPGDTDTLNSTNYIIGFEGVYGKFYSYNSLSKKWEEEMRK